MRFHVRNSLRHAVAGDVNEIQLSVVRRAWILIAVVVPLIAAVLAVTNQRLINEPDMSDSFILSLLAVSATVFALVTAIASLIISTSSNPVDRQRLMRR